MPRLEQLFAALAVVLDDAVQDDREPTVVAGGERVSVLLRDGAVRRPARVAEAGRRDRSEPLGRELQVLEVADGAEVRKPVVLEQREAGRVIAAVLEPLEPAQEKRLRGPRADVSDDPAHFVASSTRHANARNRPLETEKPGRGAVPFVGDGQPSSRRTRAAMVAQALRSRLCVAGLGEDANHRLRAGRTHEHAPGSRQLVVDPLDLGEDVRRQLADLDAHVLLHLRKDLHHRRGLAQRASAQSIRRGACRRRARRR